MEVVGNFYFFYFSGGSVCWLNNKIINLSTGLLQPNPSRQVPGMDEGSELGTAMHVTAFRAASEKVGACTKMKCLVRTSMCERTSELTATFWNR